VLPYYPYQVYEVFVYIKCVKCITCHFNSNESMQICKIRQVKRPFMCFHLTLWGLRCFLGPGGVLTFVLISVTCDIFMAKVYYTGFSTNFATIICQQHVCLQF